MVFQTARSKGITLLILLMNVLLVTIGVLSLAFGDGWVLFIICLLLAAYNDWLMLDIKYILNSTELLVKAGPVRRRFDYNSIVEITKTTSALKGTRITGSTDSIEVFYQKEKDAKSVKISPRPRNQFLEALQSKNTAIEMDRACWNNR